MELEYAYDLHSRHYASRIYRECHYYHCTPSQDICTLGHIRAIKLINISTTLSPAVKSLSPYFWAFFFEFLQVSVYNPFSAFQATLPFCDKSYILIPRTLKFLWCGCQDSLPCEPSLQGFLAPEFYIRSGLIMLRMLLHFVAS